MNPYTKEELAEIANNLRRFANQGVLEHVTENKHGDVRVHSVPMHKDRIKLIRVHALLIEHGIHDAAEAIYAHGAPLKPEVYQGYQVLKIGGVP